MRLLNDKLEEISETDVNLKKGRIYQTTIIKSDAKPIDNINKYAYEDSDYEEVLIYETISDDVFIEKRITELKKNLTDTDYVIIKIAEGAATAEEYADVIASRQEWRDEINRLEAEIQGTKTENM